MNQMAGMIERHDAVGHMQKERVQFVALVFHGGQGGLQHTGHLIECSGENADLIRGFHRQLTAEISGGHPLGACGELFNGAHHGFGEQKAQQHGNQKADNQGLHDDEKELAVEIRDRLFVIQNINDKGVISPQDRDCQIHIGRSDIAVVAHSGFILLDHGIAGGEQIGTLLPGQCGGVGGAAQIRSGGAVEHKIVAGAVIHTQRAGVGPENFLHGLSAVVLGGGLTEGENEFPAVCAEDIIHLLIEAVDVEAGDAGG